MTKSTAVRVQRGARKARSTNPRRCDGQTNEITGLRFFRALGIYGEELSFTMPLFV